MAVLLLDHVPPVVASANVIVPPAQTVLAPVMGAGAALTDMMRVATQPPRV
jgi:hypothetical protein